MLGGFFRVKPELFDEIMGEEINLVEDLFILVLDQIDKNAVLVAQIGPKQIIGDEFTTEFGFIQTWNIYTMGVQDLDGPIRTIDPEVLKSIKDRIQDHYIIDLDIQEKYLEQINLGSIVAQASISKLL